MKLIDTHVHLSDGKFDTDRDQVIARALHNGIAMITPGGSAAPTRAKMLQIAESNESIWLCFGVHPFNAEYAEEAELTAIEHLASNPKVVGIGEIGLDQDEWDFDIAPFDVQQRAFKKQLALAARVALPVALHIRARKAVDAAIEILADAVIPNGGVVHNFHWDWATAERFLELGLHLAIGGEVTWASRDDLRAAVRQIPIDRLVIETDAPYLTPVPHEGSRNEPSYVKRVAERIAGLRGIPVTEVARQTTENATRLFSLREIDASVQTSERSETSSE